MGRGSPGQDSHPSGAPPGTAARALGGTLAVSCSSPRPPDRATARRGASEHGGASKPECKR
eukprot:1289189-Alexandrium_andersonii.AAC.1